MSRMIVEGCQPISPMQSASRAMNESLRAALRHMNDMDEEMRILREENTRLLEEASWKDIVIDDMQEEIDLLKGGNNKRKRDEESEDAGAGETHEKECIGCKKTKTLTSFQVKATRKNKAGHIIGYYTHRKLCHACHKKKHREGKKAKVSK